MRFATLAACGASLVAAAAPQAQDLVVTGLFDGPLSGGTPKVIELYVVNAIPDLSRYAFGSASNGGGTDGAEFTFPMVAAAAGSYIEIATEVPGFTAYFGGTPDYTTNTAGINGDDAVEVFFDANGDAAFDDTEVIDTFGDLTYAAGASPTLPWNYMDGWVYRKNSTGPDGATFALDSWTYSGQNATDGATTNDTAPSRFPIRSYTRTAVAGESTPAIGLSLTVANPIRGAAQVRFAAPGAEARLAVYDVLGRRVATLADGVSEGATALPGLSAGVYVLRLTAGADALTRVVTVIR